MVPQLEAWGRWTARLFGELRRQASLKPADTLDDQAWYWTEHWQCQEKQADQDVAAGRVKNFASMDDLIADLEV